MRITLVSIISLVVSSIAFGQLLPVKTAEGYGFKQGEEWVIKPQFSYATHFTEGVALVQTAKGWGHIDSTGKFIAGNDFSSASVMRNGHAWVWRGKLQGMIDNNGNFILKPEFDSIINVHRYQPDSWNVWRNGLIGRLDSTSLIPAKYTSYEIERDFLSAKRPDGKWDVWFKHIQIAEGVKNGAGSQSAGDRWAETIILESKGKYGMYNKEKGWVVQPVYDTIWAIEFHEYLFGRNSLSNYLYVLDLEHDQSEGSDGPVNFMLAQADGSLISENLILHPVKRPSWEGETFDQLRTAKGIVQINVEEFQGDYDRLRLKVTEYPYTSLKRLSDRFFQVGLPSGKEAIVDTSFKTIIVADSIRSATADYEGVDEAGQRVVVHVIERYSETLEIYDMREGNVVAALYDPKEGKLISPWLQDPLFTFNKWGEDADAGYIYRERNSKLAGFYFKGMKAPTPPLYKQATFLQFDCIQVDIPDGKHQLLQLGGAEPQLLMEGDVIFRSRDVEVRYTEEGEVLPKWFMSTFSEDFICSQNVAGKLGFRTFNGVRIPDRFDSIGENASFSKFIDVCENGLYGVVNLRNGKIIEPFSKTPLIVGYSRENNIYYVEEETGYTDERGKFYSMAPDGYFEIYKQKGRYGLMTKSDFDEERDSIYITPPVYRKMMHSTVDGSTMYIVQGDEGYGLLNFRGDTIVPLVYDKFVPAFHQDGMLPGMWTYKGKKKGAVVECKGGVVPALYDEIEDLLEFVDAPPGLRVKLDGKQGFYAYDGSLVLPVIYDGIAIRPMNDEGGHTKMVLVLEKGKWRVQTTQVEMKEDFCQSYQSYIQPVDTSLFTSFDQVINNMGFVRKANGYDVYDYVLSIYKPTSGVAEDSIVVANADYDFFLEKGLVGIRSKEGKVLVKPQFTYIRYVDSYFSIVVENGEELLLDIETGKRNKLSHW